MGLGGHHYICLVNQLFAACATCGSTTPLLSTLFAHVYTGVGSRTASVIPSIITKTLRTSVQFLGAELGFLSSKISVRSLRAAGNGVDGDQGGPRHHPDPLPLAVQ